jgi:RND family efflux transporter MFP subunit
LFAAGLLVGVGCSEKTVEQAAPVVRPVKTLTIAEGGATLQRSYPGRVAAASQVDLSFRVGGPLIELPAMEGQRIRRDQVLARIDPRDYEIRLDAARAQHELAQADFDRIASLYERDAVSKAQLDQARAARDLAKSEVDNAEADLGDTRLRAPFGGLIGATFVENFQDVQPRESILSLIAVDQVDVVVDLPESIVAQIREGEQPDVRLYATFESAPGRTFDLKVSELATQADARTQTYRVTLRMKQPEGVTILPGMTANVSGEVTDDGREDRPVVVPAVAVVTGAEGAHVWVVDTSAMTVHQRAVTVGGLEGSDAIEILSGLEPGDTIAVSAVSRLQEGMQVTSWTR